MKLVIEHIRLPQRADIIFDIDPSETLGAIKAKIESVVGHPLEFSSDQWRLFPTTKLLVDDNRTLSSYYLPKDEIHLTLLNSQLLRGGPRVQSQPKAADKEPDKKENHETLANMQITFKKLSEETFTFDFAPSDTIESVKAKIKDTVGMLPKDQYLFLAGEPLGDCQTLADGGVRDGDIIWVKFGPMGHD